MKTSEDLGNGVDPSCCGDTGPRQSAFTGPHLTRIGTRQSGIAFTVLAHNVSGVPAEQDHTTRRIRSFVNHQPQMGLSPRISLEVRGLQPHRMGLDHGAFIRRRHRPPLITYEAYCFCAGAEGGGPADGST